MSVEKQRKITTAESVSAARKLDHLMMLLAPRLCTGKKVDLDAALTQAIKDRDAIYQQIDLQNKAKATRANMGKKKAPEVVKTNVFNRLTGKSEPIR